MIPSTTMKKKLILILSILFSFGQYTTTEAKKTASLKSFLTKTQTKIKNAVPYKALPLLFNLGSLVPAAYYLKKHGMTNEMTCLTGLGAICLILICSKTTPINKQKNSDLSIKEAYTDQFKKEMQRCGIDPNFASVSLAPGNSPHGNAYCVDKTIFLNSANLLKIDGKDGDLKEKNPDQNEDILTLFDENETPTLNFIFRHELAHAYHNDSKKRIWHLHFNTLNLILMSIIIYNEVSANYLDSPQQDLSFQSYEPNGCGSYLQTTTGAGFYVSLGFILNYSYNGMITNAEEYEADRFAINHSTAKECYAFANYIESLIKKEEKYISSLKFPFSLLPIPAITEHPSMRDRCEYLRACAKEKEIQEQKEKISL